MKMKDTSRRILEFLKVHQGEKLTNADVATQLGVSAPTVVGSVNSFVKKGWAVRTPVELETPEGKTITVKYISLTSNGLSFNPDAVEEDKED
jgi:DNA-binding MarR family transcriptional regulator